VIGESEAAEGVAVLKDLRGDGSDGGRRLAFPDLLAALGQG
jgi:hypothetical protein